MDKGLLKKCQIEVHTSVCRNVSSMSRQNVPSPSFNTSAGVQGDVTSSHLKSGRSGFRRRPSLFWHDRLIEGGLILSMALYYLVGNPNIMLYRLHPLLSLPFLLIFAVLCWYRLPFAVALLPLSLPYYLPQKVVVSHYAFSLAEITLWTCIAVAAVQIFSGRKSYGLSWPYMRERLGPFTLPMLIFFGMAAVSVIIAYAHGTALRAFREEVLGPLLYLCLALLCLRTRQDVVRLLSALLGAALIVALLGMAQYFLFKNSLVLEDGVRRVHAVYGSANNIGLFFDYVLPIGFALLIAGISWRSRVLAAVVCLPLLFVLYLTQSRGAWIAITVAALFVVVLWLCNRGRWLIGIVVPIIVLALALFLFHDRIIDFVLQGHVSNQGISTVTRRLYLWESALRMIHDSPWLGYGMDNWLCHYSKNTICDAHAFHYWILTDPVTGKPTGLLDEPTLSHPHNIFLHVWVSIGVFGLLAFITIIILFYALFTQIMRHLARVENGEQLRWMTIGVGAAMLAALVQGQVDSAFLEQDLAFCFWTLVAALLILRTLSGTAWQTMLPQRRLKRAGIASAPERPTVSM